VTINPINQDSVEAWINEADRLLPRMYSSALKFVNTHLPPAVRVPELKTLIPYTEDGIPLWPQIDLKQTSPDNIEVMLKRYLQALWGT
jgi:hypothetical protein